MGKQKITIKESELRGLVEQTLRDYQHESFVNEVADRVMRRLSERALREPESPEEVVEYLKGIGEMAVFDMSDVDEEAEEVYVGYNPKANMLYAGGATNAGIIPEYQLPYDFNITFDRNMEALYDEVADGLMRGK